MKTSIVRYTSEDRNVEKAIQLCDGLSALKPGSKVLIKPNCVFPGLSKKKPSGTVDNDMGTPGNSIYPFFLARTENRR